MIAVDVWSVPTLVHVRLTGTCVVTIRVHVGPDTRTRVAAPLGLVDIVVPD
jgi:multisubunit Na+/H+ antiporter MnhF subunit